RLILYNKTLDTVIMSAIIPSLTVSTVKDGNTAHEKGGVKNMILKLGIFFVAIGAVKLVTAIIARVREARG
ncbi:MAG: hypothetical protein LUD53_00910, partial [Clostridiales bacterium]|nr:hypothetical protein [Clostridiales bacterium]